LKDAADGENFEWTDMYARMAAEAREDGFADIAFLFDKVGAIEKEHEARYRALLKNIEDGSVFQKPTPEDWHCLNCGYGFKSETAPKMCPVCKHPQSYFQINNTNY
jgi:rubrerythrin